MRQRFSFAIFLSVFLVWMSGCGVESTEKLPVKLSADLSALFPAAGEVEGLKSADDYREYGRDQLFEYMNGGAEVYLALQFSRVGTREYVTALGEDIYLTIEMYDMGVADDARAIFRRHHAEDAPTAGVGEESTMGGGTLEFLHGQYYNRIRCDDMGPEVDRVLRDAAKILNDRLDTRA